MTYATYAPRVAAHPTRTGARRTNNPSILVVHTSEGNELPTGAENLAYFISTPRTASNLASYHYITDTDKVIPVVPDNYCAYAAGGGNAQGLHVCHPGRASQTREQWLDVNSGPQLEQVARWLADKHVQYGIPLVKLTVAQVRAGVSGVCGHVDVSLAFKKSDHTDPGTGYPWDVVIARARQFVAPPAPVPGPTPPAPAPSASEEDDMWFLSQWEPDGSWWEIRADKKARRGPIAAHIALPFIASGVPNIKLPNDELPTIPIPA